MDKKLSSALSSFSLEAKKLESTYNQLHQDFREFQKRWKTAFTTMQNVIAYMSDGLLFIAPSGVILLTNPSLLRFLGLQEQIKGSLYSDFFSDRFFGFSIRELFRYPNKVVRVRAALEHTNTDVEVTASHIPEQGLMIILKDLSLSAIDIASQQNARLEQIGHMATALVHEIKNPLGGIQGFASLLEERLDESKEKELAHAIVEGTKTLDALISSVLSYAKPLKVHLTREDLSPLILDIQQLCTMEFKKELSVEWDGLPIEVSCDRTLCKRLLLNLLRNAYQASCHWILLRIIRFPLRIIIENDGIIPQETIPHLFTPFFTTRAEGTGLGLAEVKKIIDAHGWSIDVQVTNKTSFTITCIEYGKNPCRR